MPGTVTRQARDDLAGIRQFISQDSPYYADVVVARVIVATERLTRFPRSGRVVPEWNTEDVREVVHPPYRVIYRLLAELAAAGFKPMEDVQLFTAKWFVIYGRSGLAVGKFR